MAERGCASAVGLCGTRSIPSRSRRPGTHSMKSIRSIESNLRREAGGCLSTIRCLRGSLPLHLPSMNYNLVNPAPRPPLHHEHCPRVALPRASGGCTLRTTRRARYQRAEGVMRRVTLAALLLLTPARVGHPAERGGRAVTG